MTRINTVIWRHFTALTAVMVWTAAKPPRSTLYLYTGREALTLWSLNSSLSSSSTIRELLLKCNFVTWNVSHDNNISKYLASNLTNLTNFNPLEAVDRMSFKWVKIWAKTLNDERINKKVPSSLISFCESLTPTSFIFIDEWINAVTPTASELIWPDVIKYQV